MEPIAIIGLGCLFPGADGPAAFWQNLVNGVDSTSVATAAEIGADPAVFFDPARQQADGYAYGRGGFVRGFRLDPAGLNLSAEQLRGLDPLYQWALHVARQALGDSGYLGRADLLDRCGVVLGNLSFPTRSSRQMLAPLYAGVVAEALDDMRGSASDPTPPLPARERGLGGEGDSSPINPLNASISGRPAALVAQALGLGGPSLALDAACASSLYALGLACDYLAAGRADLMLAGAVSCADPLFVLTGFSIFKAYPPEGEVSRPLDRSSRGLTAGEGAGVFALKRYADALRDGDRIYGLVRGVGLSNDGAGKHVLVPNPKGQQLAFERAYAAAGVPPQSIAYVECHATGTPVGDIIELNSMERFFGAYGHAPRIGSVKSNFGHLLTAAGMAGMLKVLLSMAHGQIPPTLTLSDPLISQGGKIGGAGSVQTLAPWPALPGPRRAGVSAFGFGGTNAHVVLEGYAALTQGEESPTPPSPVQGEGGWGGEGGAMAITGMDACFGPYPDLAALDRGLYAGERAFGPPPAGRWHGLESRPLLHERMGLPDTASPDRSNLAGFSFDFLRSKIPPDPADQPLPQQLLLLQVADRALRDAGVRPGAHIAVLVAMETESAMHALRGRQDLTWQLPSLLAQVGVNLSDAERAELEILLKDALHPQAQVNQYVSFIGNIMACRVAALWDFSGPAFTVSADEISAFRALELAQIMLARGELEAVVVAAVDLAGSIERVILDTAAGQAGRAVGEGAGALVLRRAADAHQSGQRIYATVDAVALVASAHPPLTPALSLRERESNLPSLAGRGAGGVGESARQALAAAGVRPSEVGYLELSGDSAAEVAALGQVYDGTALTRWERESDLPSPRGRGVGGEGAPQWAAPTSPATLVRLPLPDRLETPVPDGWSCVITDDGTPTAAALAAALAARGWQPVVLRLPTSLVGARPALPPGVGRVALHDLSEGQLEQALRMIAEGYGPVGGFIHLHPQPAALPHTTDLLNDSEQQIVRLIFLAAKLLAPTLTTAGRSGRSLFMAVTRMDGELGTGTGRAVSPVGGGLFGLVKTVHQEWAGVFCRGIDLSPEIGAEQSAQMIVAESSDPDLRLVEVGYGPRGRATLAAHLPIGGA